MEIGKGSLTKEEIAFLAAARKAETMPSADNKKKVKKAFDKLPKNSACRNMDFQGKHEGKTGRGVFG